MASVRSRAFAWEPPRWSSSSPFFPCSSSSPALLLRAGQGGASRGRRIGRARCSTWSHSASGSRRSRRLRRAILVAQGAGRDAFDDIFLYGRALATDTLPEPEAPPGVIRWITGNADPRGPASLAVRSRPTTSSGGEPRAGRSGWHRSPRSLTCCSVRERPPRAGWSPAGRSRPGPRSLCRASTGSTTICCRSPAPPSPSRSALTDAALCLACAIRPVGKTRRPRTVAGSRSSGTDRRTVGLAVVRGLMLLATAIGTTVFLEVRDYLLVASRGADDSIQGRAAMGRACATMGRELSRRARIWKDPHLYIWGWQSPLHFYWANGQPDAPFLRRQPAARPGRPRSPADPPADRGDHGDPAAQAAGADLHGLSAVPRAQGILERSLLAVADGAGTVGPAGGYGRFDERRLRASGRGGLRRRGTVKRIRQLGSRHSR